MNFLILSVILVLSLACGLIVANLIVLVLFMEVTLFTFLFMAYNYKVLNYSAACMKYFLIQSMSSLMLLVVSFFLMMYLSWEIPLWYTFMVFTGLFTKLGAFPMHFWVVPVFKEMPFYMLGVLGMPMKVLPLSFLNSILLFPSMFKMFNFLMVVAVASMLIGMILGLTATNLRAVLGASSITHTGWFLFALCGSGIIKYFLLYSLTLGLLLWSLNYSSPITVSLSLFGLSGLPPFSVFFAKVLVLSSLCNSNAMLVFVVVALLISAFSLFYYLKYSFYFFLSQYASSVISWPLVILFFMVNMSSASMLVFLFFYGRVWP